MRWVWASLRILLFASRRDFAGHSAQIRDEMGAQTPEQPGMAYSGYCADGSEYPATWENGEKSQTDHRIAKQSWRFEIRILWIDDFVEFRDRLMELRAYPADKEVAKGRKFAKQKSGPVLETPIGLGKRREDNITFLHAP
jgi:hypothetical protein